MSEKKVSDFSEAGTSKRETPTWKEILLPVKDRIEAICQGNLDFGGKLWAIGDVCYKLGRYIETGGMEFEANGSFENDMKSLDDDVHEAFDQIEKANYQGQDLEKAVNYTRELGSKGMFLQTQDIFGDHKSPTHYIASPRFFTVRDLASSH